MVVIAFVAVAATALHAQQEPRIGYAYPAGARRGSTVEVTIGGQFLDGTQSALITGGGVKATVVRYNKPLPQKRFNELRDYLEETRKKMADAKASQEEMRKFNSQAGVTTTLKVAGASDNEIDEFLLMRKQRNDPHRQENQQLSESITLKVEVAPDAPPGVNELRLLSPGGATNPVQFCVGDLPETTDAGDAGKTLDTAAKVALPGVINGWIPPGGVHHYAFQASRGEHLVIAVQARSLVPFLADAVPGWFQPAITVRDAKGHEMVSADHFRFTPDPALCYEVPQDGAYLLEIRDALYRGREDFVYRITIGNVPFVTGIFPLGGMTGVPTLVEKTGWNLTGERKILLDAAPSDGVRPVSEIGGDFAVPGILFASDSIPQIAEAEPNDNLSHAQTVTLPTIINGRINAPGDVDVFSLSCRARTKVVAEVRARRLNSPLDSWLKVTDAAGKQIAFNDDADDKAAGLLTQNADSRVEFTAPANGTYYIHLGDTQNHGGPEYAYRLRISAPMPDFALRIVPSCINAHPGATLPVTIYALRKDGFNGDIQVALKDTPQGFQLDGGWIPAGQDKVRATLTVPQGPAPTPGPRIAATPTPSPSPSSTPQASTSPTPTSPTPTSPPLAPSAAPTPPPPPPPIKTVALVFEGSSATTTSGTITHIAVPADDRMQAFAYHHLVTAKQFLAVMSGFGRGRAPISITSRTPLQLPAGGSGEVTLALAGKKAPFAQNETQLQLNGAPDGVTLDGFAPAADGVVVTFNADPTKAKAGLKGNLIVEAFVEREQPSKDGKPPVKHRFSIGLLPAIPFEIK